MKKSISKYIFIIIFLLLIIGGIIYFNVWNNGKQESEIKGSRISTSINTENTNVQTKQPPKETQISTFSTPIKDKSPRKTY